MGSSSRASPRASPPQPSSRSSRPSRKISPTLPLSTTKKRHRPPTPPRTTSHTLSQTSVSSTSIHALTWQSVQASDIDVRKELCKNLILSGGTTMYQGLPDRLKDEIVGLAPAGAEIKVIASADRKFAVWKGASTFSSLSSFASSWITADDYKEHGAAIVHRKCT